jgi:hypothetical protein
MPADEFAAIQAFVDELVGLPAARGTVMAANMVDSAALVEPRLIAEFLLACASTQRAHRPPLGADAVVAQVALAKRAMKDDYLRSGPASDRFDGQRIQLKTVLRTDSFFRFLVADRFKVPAGRIPVVIPPQPQDSQRAARRYQRRLARLLARPDWHRPGATLGKSFPDPINCWLTNDQFGTDPDAPAYGDDAASMARDELGLASQPNSRPYLLSISFPTGSLAAIPDVTATRPTFGDGGNARFVVMQGSARSGAFYAAGWGATAHLGKLDGAGEAVGVPECVASPLPLGALLPSLEVRYLGRAAPEGHHSADRFERYVLGDRTVADVKARLLALISR